MASQLFILPRNGTSLRDDRVARIAGFMGIPTVNAGDVCPNSVVVAHCDALMEWMDSTDESDPSGSWPWNGARAIFIYGWKEGKKSDELLARLTDGILRRVNPIPPSPHCFAVPVGSETLCFSMAGANFQAQVAGGMVHFGSSEGFSAGRPLLTCNDTLVSVALDIGGRELWLSGVEDLADLDLPVAREFSILSELPRLAPVMMFIRHCFGKQCWQTELSGAALIVDDPLLRPQYGFLNYAALLKSMKQHKFSTTVAFVSWNYRRTHRSVAQMFLEHKDSYSLSIHGCDHTKGEFGSVNSDELRYRITTALWRMEQHQHISAVPFDPVIVFPQGVFSECAMAALSESQMLAAVNSHPFPIQEMERPLTLAELLEPAVTRFSNFPLFTRRYPWHVAEFAFDLFLGKPILIVEHHDYFTHGFGPLEAFVTQLNALPGKIHWGRLRDICSSTSLRRHNGDGSIDVRCYVDEFVLMNQESTEQSYTLFRRADIGPKVELVNVNGNPASWEIEGPFLKVALRIAAGGKANVSVVRAQPRVPSAKWVAPLTSGPRIFCRRHLSELRDNFIDKSPMTKRAVQFVRQSLKGSSKRNGAASK